MLARQRWTMPYLGAAARVPFAVQGLRGLLDITVHPFAGVSGLTRPEVAISTGAGVAYARGRLDVQLGYAFERYDFARGTVAERFEQLSVLTLQVQVRALERSVPLNDNGAVPRGGAAIQQVPCVVRASRRSVPPDPFGPGRLRTRPAGLRPAT